MKAIGFSFRADDAQLARNLRWWAFYAIVQIFCHVALSSVGAFFHFLLGHGINLVEGWLYESGWELVLASKAFSLWATHKLLSIRLYRPRPILSFLKEEFRWPGQKVLVISIFLLSVLLILGGPKEVSQNQAYWFSHLTAYVAIVVWFLADIIMAALLHDLFPVTSRAGKGWRLGFYIFCFFIFFRLAVPDYYGTAFLVHLQFFTVLYLAGNSFRSWGESITYLVIVAAPMGALLGLDPLWSSQFASFQLAPPPAAPFLLVIWMLSWAYYTYRHKWRLPQWN